MLLYNSFIANRFILKKTLIVRTIAVKIFIQHWAILGEALRFHPRLFAITFGTAEKGINVFAYV